tara:strand:- start:158 stop:457 length:300 start_codon:yes stop_codon:yes gene_type:complete
MTNDLKISRKNRALFIAGNVLIFELVSLMFLGKLGNLKFLIIAIFISFLLYLITVQDWSKSQNKFFEFTGFGSSLIDELHGKKYEYERLMKPNSFVEEN